MDYLGYGVVHSPILVTGADGYLGGHIFEMLGARDIPRVGVTRKAAGVMVACDLTLLEEVEASLAATSPGCIIHCAAAVPKNRDGYDDQEAAEQSLKMALNIASSAPCPVVFASSMTVYDSRLQGMRPIKEAAACSPPAGGYALGKWTAEREMAELARHGLVALRFPGLFGPPRCQGVLYNAARAFLTGTPFSLDNPVPMWAAFDVRDAAQACVNASLLEPFPRREVVNIGYEGDFSLPKAVSILAALCGVDWHADERNAPQFQMDLQCARKLLGISSVDFRDRLARLVGEVTLELAQEKQGNA